jgi:hypothetical protein
MEFIQALNEATRTKRSKTYIITGRPERIAAELDGLEVKHGDQPIKELIAWNEREPMPRDDKNIPLEVPKI